MERENRDASLFPYWHKLAKSPEQAFALKKIAGYDFSEVRERVLKDKAVPTDDVDEAIEEFRKYMMLIQVGTDGLAMTSAEVDEIWHMFILFTMDYSEFCNDVFGGYIHHQPNTEKTPVAENAVRVFRETYRSAFGELPDIWLRRAVVTGCSGSTNCQGKDCYVCAKCRDKRAPVGTC